MIIRKNKKYLEVKEIDEIQSYIEDMLKTKYGLKIKTHFHPTYIEVPNFEDIEK